MLILAFDPGYVRLGVSVIEKVGGASERLVYSACFITDKDSSPQERLFFIGSEIRRLIEKYSPGGIAVEKLFFTKNQKTAMRVAEVRGVILECSAEKKIPLFEYGPTEIKTAITGYGKSDKEQVIMMVKKLLKIEDKNRLDDEYDAIAVGLTCFAYEKFG